MKPRIPQLALRLDAAAPDADAPWRAGGTIAFLGGKLTLVLDTACPLPERVGAELHLPLPPAATPRQIRDAAESWLRDEALRQFNAVAAAKSALGGRRQPRIVLTFGKGGDWVRVEGETLRCRWRLIEQPETVVAQVLERAVAQTCQAPACDDLFALA
jgi:predicted metal-dependent hydrolase